MALLTFAVGIYWKRLVIKTWISQNLQQPDTLGWLMLLSATLTLFVWCTGRFTDSWYKQQRCLIVVLPMIKQDIAHIKQDIADIKHDIADITCLLS